MLLFDEFGNISYFFQKPQVPNVKSAQSESIKRRKEPPAVILAQRLKESTRMRPDQLTVKLSVLDTEF